MTAALLLLWAAFPLQARAAEPPAAGARSVVGGLVRSREWIIRRAPSREEEFIGDVSYRKGPDFFRADWALFAHETQSWRARGEVRLEHRFESGDRLQVRGDRAEFDQVRERGRLFPAPGGRILFARQPAVGEPDHGSAGGARWEGRARAAFDGGVRVWGPRLELAGRRGDYDAASGELVVAGGRPVLRILEGDWNGAVQADELAARRGPDTLRARGRARGWIRFTDDIEKLARREAAR